MKNYFVIQFYKFIIFIVTEKVYFVNQVYKICFSGCFLKKTCVYWFCMNMTVTDIQGLYYIMWRDMDTPEGKKAKEGEVVEDAIVHGEV